MNSEAILDQLRQYIRSRIEERRQSIVRDAVRELKERRVSDVRNAVEGQVEAAVMGSIEWNSGEVVDDDDQG